MWSSFKIREHFGTMETLVFWGMTPSSVVNGVSEERGTSVFREYLYPECRRRKLFRYACDFCNRQGIIIRKTWVFTNVVMSASNLANLLSRGYGRDRCYCRHQGVKKMWNEIIELPLLVTGLSNLWPIRYILICRAGGNTEGNMNVLFFVKIHGTDFVSCLVLAWVFVSVTVVLCCFLQ